MKALIIIDVQNGLMEKNLFNKDEFIQTINKAISKASKENNPILFIQHNSKTLENGKHDWQLFPQLTRPKNEIIIQKKHGDAFKDTGLKQILEKKNIKEIIICGLVSHGCVLYTCKTAKEYGFTVKLLKNGHTNWLKNAEEKILEVNKKLESIGIEMVESTD